MELEEAIKHAEEVADTCEYEASKYDMSDSYERSVACQEGKCAEDHRQLAEWLKELRQLRKVVEKINEMIYERGVSCAYDMPSFWYNNGKDYKVIPTKFHKGYQQALDDVQKRIEEILQEADNGDGQR